ncbi:MAG: hypothetical protein ABIA97_01085 [Candidatus Omnitrophota bacterium]
MQDAKLIEKIVVKCKKCRKRLRLPLFPDSLLEIKCPSCGFKFEFNCRRFRKSQQIRKIAVVFLIPIFLFIDVFFAVLLVNKLDKNVLNLEMSYKERIQINKRLFSNDIKELKKKYIAEIKSINVDKLKEKASKKYAKIWDERKNYDKKYAITTREKVQMEMLALASDSTKEINKIVSEIAAKVAPENSEIKSYVTNKGVLLSVDFSMSDVTRGEEGTRTKHFSIDSLKNETLRLVSRVSNDVYNFCRDLDLETITIGCKHEVTISYPDGTNAGKDELVIFKVRLDKQNIRELKHNPFLDTYSVTQYLNVIEDNFSTLRIVKQ